VIESILWTRDALEADRITAIGLFRKERLEEPLEEYLEGFDKYQGYVEELLETTVDLARLEGTGLEVLSDPRLLPAFRYIAAPPTSTNDLKVLADATLSKGQLKKKLRTSNVWFRSCVLYWIVAVSRGLSKTESRRKLNAVRL
jgi:hypothetical protein